MVDQEERLATATVDQPDSNQQAVTVRTRPEKLLIDLTKHSDYVERVGNNRVKSFVLIDKLYQKWEKTVGDETQLEIQLISRKSQPITPRSREVILRSAGKGTSNVNQVIDANEEVGIECDIGVVLRKTSEESKEWGPFVERNREVLLPDYLGYEKERLSVREGAAILKDLVEAQVESLESQLSEQKQQQGGNTIVPLKMEEHTLVNTYEVINVHRKQQDGSPEGFPPVMSTFPVVAILTILAFLIYRYYRLLQKLLRRIGKFFLQVNPAE